MSNSNLHFGEINKHLLALLSQVAYSKLFILVDENTSEHCLPILDLPEHELISITSGEKHKNLQTCQHIWASLLAKQADRQALLINLGGGVIGDMGGFCAASFKRGLPFVNIPTTLLAMVDASVGGKTGVDFMNQKNMIGLFSEASATIVDPIFLDTLDKRQIKSGRAEMIKHGLIANKEHLEACMKVDKPNLALIQKSVHIKQEIVKADPYERGIRKALNFGHTLGHAIESASLSEGEDILHGEAVAWGMILELKLSVHKLGLNANIAEEYIKQLKQTYGGPNMELNYLDGLIDLCLNDKKNNSSDINFTLLRELEQVELNVNLKREEILKLLQT